MADNELTKLVIVKTPEEGKGGSDAWFWGGVGPDGDDDPRMALSFIDTVQAWLNGESDGEETASSVRASSPPEGAQGKAQEALLDDLRAWRLKSKRRGKVAPFASDVLPDEIINAVKFLGQDNWRRGFEWVARMQAYKADKEPDREAEAALRDEITDMLEDWRTRIARAIFDGEPLDYDAISQELDSLLVRYLTGAAIDEFMSMSAMMGISFDIALVNIAALEWASAYSYELIKDIAATTQKLVAQAISQFVLTPGMTIGDIEELLVRAFGPVRAEMIAVTETTRAYSQGTRILQDMLKRSGLDMVRIWKTGYDDKVCDLCRPLEGKAEDDWPSERKPDGPPAHINCRCGTTLRLRSLAKSLDEDWPWLADEIKIGTAASGSWGHAGRPGARGGQASGSAGLSRIGASNTDSADARRSLSRQAREARSSPPPPVAPKFNGSISYVPIGSAIRENQTRQEMASYGLTEDDVKAMCAWPDENVHAQVSLYADEGEFHVVAEYHNQHGEKIADMERLFQRDMGREKVVDHELLTIDKKYQDRGLADKLYEQQFQVYQKLGVSRVEVFADISIGKYAWAKKGFQYAHDYDADDATRRFPSWCKDKGVSLESYPKFKTPQDVINFKAPGVRVNRSSISNRDIKPGDYDLGKAFMLDDYSNGGHGDWYGRFDLKG